MTLFDEKYLRLREELDALDAYKEIPLEEYRRKKERRLAIERLLMKVLERTMDLARLVAAERGLSPGASTYDLADQLATNKVIPPDFLPVVRRMIGMRNVLVHEYDRLDDAVVHQAVTRHLPDILALTDGLAKAHAAFLERHPHDQRTPS